MSDPERAAPRPPPFPVEPEARCEVCGGGTLYWRNCKLVCAECRHINKSCADL